MKMMSKFKLFLFTGVGFVFDWVMNMQKGFNLDDPTFYITPVYINSRINYSFKKLIPKLKICLLKSGRT
jgi:hypothetical protein